MPNQKQKNATRKTAPTRPDPQAKSEPQKRMTTGQDDVRDAPESGDKVLRARHNAPHPGK